MDSLLQLQDILRQTLQIDVETFDQSTPLLGAIPEFDSMAVIMVITAIEEQFNISIEDDEISAEIFETIGSLLQFIESKTA